MKNIKIDLITNLIELRLLLKLFPIHNNYIKLSIETIKNNLMMLNSLNNSLNKETIKDINNISNLNKKDLNIFIEKNLKVLLYDKIQ